MTIQPMLAVEWNPYVGVPLLIIGALVLAGIWLFGQPKQEQGRRRPQPERAQDRREPVFGDVADQGRERQEPSISALDDDPAIAVPRNSRPAQGELDVGLREELERLGATLAGEKAVGKSEPSLGSVTAKPKSSGPTASIIDALRAPSALFESTLAAATPSAPAAAAAAAQAPEPAPATPAEPPRSNLGRRPPQLRVERIVTLFVVAREGQLINGADLVVAAEKAGLEFGDMGIYHRLLDGKRELGPIFSVANMLKPGNFDLARVDALRTPGLSFFMALPGPLSALDAWDAMLPTAQRLAELLDGQVLDEERNALGRQRIAHIRDELRGWDRDHEGEEISFGR